MDGIVASMILAIIGLFVAFFGTIWTDVANYPTRVKRVVGGIGFAFMAPAAVRLLTLAVFN